MHVYRYVCKCKYFSFLGISAVLYSLLLFYNSCVFLNEIGYINDIMIDMIWWHYITLHKKLFRVAYSLKTSKPLNGAQMNQS